MNVSSRIEALVAPARAAGELLQERFVPGRKRDDVERKEGGEEVTAADRDADALLRDALRHRFPGAAVVSEEGGETGGARATAEILLLVDPLDGTNNFTRGLPDFSVSVALLERRDGAWRPVAGVVHRPLGGEVYWGEEGKGAGLLHAAGRKALAVSRVESLAGVRLVLSRLRADARTLALARRLGVGHTLLMGSAALMTCAVAQGRGDAYVHGARRPLGAWDTAAAEVVLREAGGRITDLEGRELTYEDEEFRHPRGVAASNGRVHVELLEAVRELMAEVDR